ncbi:hypothetical protein WOLCODRAFT_108360 [Wolfiporia cocos MD-104 SS10]|uniref:Zn(2)-C6 fungal-type domain-containing protein n=1 Tax=Wolfiporia cocos (strain MD-104) TaxID=742152 RepID=A0A2H3J2J5_WOLCO|nr:hypothetical protein WOLCODRAFT_108360 [Wolfiporia cocos MD-104 SS10]
MSATSSSAPLERGKACIRCRRRKMRCDGAHPACDQCARADRGADCEYSDGQGPTTSQLLEQQVTQLEGRIAELESAQAPLVLHDPYEAYHRSQGTQRQNRMLHTLMTTFFQHSFQVGFFLHVPRFLQKISAPTPSGIPTHFNLLLNAIYLLGAQFSSDAQLQAQQSTFLSRALAQVTSAMSHTNSSAILYVLQAEILLANYFFDNNRSLEGTYHSTAAASIALACKLHQIRSSRGQTVSSNAQYRLDPPLDSIEEGERVNAFWTTYILDKCWSTALGSSSAFVEDESKGTIIDTPWPLNQAAYQNVSITQGLRTSHTVQTFLQGAAVDAPDTSLLSLQAKAATLFAYAGQLASRWDQNNASYQARFTHLTNRIERFRQSLPSIRHIDPARTDIMRSLLVVHTVNQCAMITLHKPLEQRTVAINGISWTAASTAAGLLQGLGMGSISYVNPVMGNLFTKVAEVLILGINTARSQNAVNSSNRAMLLAPLTQILSAMGTWSIRSPLATTGGHTAERHWALMTEQAQHFETVIYALYRISSKRFLFIYEYLQTLFSHYLLTCIHIPSPVLG